MNTSKTEFLSAFLDDEAGEFERRRLVDELSRDDELGQTLGRYALLGEVMRAKQSTIVPDSRQFLAGIQAGLEDEPDYNEAVVQFEGSPASGQTQRHWREGAMRFGMAASVAVAAIAGILLLQQPGSDTPVENLAANDGVAAQAKPAALSLAAKPVSDDKVMTNTITLADSSRMRQGNKHLDWQTRDALKQYITLHMQHRANNGIVPSIQAASYAK